MVKDHFGYGFTPHGGDNSKGGKTVFGQLPEGLNRRVIRCYKKLMVKHLMQPGFDRL